MRLVVILAVLFVLVLTFGGLDRGCAVRGGGPKAGKEVEHEERPAHRGAGGGGRGGVGRADLVDR